MVSIVENKRDFVARGTTLRVSMHWFLSGQIAVDDTSIDDGVKVAAI